MYMNCCIFIYIHAYRYCKCMFECLSVVMHTHACMHKYMTYCVLRTSLVHMHVCIYTYTNTCMTYFVIRTSTSSHTYSTKLAYIHVSMHTYMYSCMYVIHACIRTCTHTCMRACTYTWHTVCSEPRHHHILTQRNRNQCGHNRFKRSDTIYCEHQCTYVHVCKYV
jgi:hypothetical protein